MPSEEIYTHHSGFEFPLVPEPYCRCSLPIPESYRKWETCASCKRRWNFISQDDEEHGGPTAIWGATPYRFQRAIAVGLYVRKNTVGELVSKIFELKRDASNAELFADAMAYVLVNRHPEIQADLIVPIPSSPQNPVNPGFEMATHLSRILDLELADVISLDPSYRPSKEAPDWKAKFLNARGKITITTPALVVGRSVLLVDDVLTIGGLAHWSSRSLLEAGAKEVNVIVAVRATDTIHLDKVGYEGRF